MKNPFRRKKQRRTSSWREPDRRDSVDLDRDHVPLGDASPEGRFFSLIMRHGAAAMTANRAGGWDLSIAGKTFTGTTQLEAIKQAEEELG